MFPYLPGAENRQGVVLHMLLHMTVAIRSSDCTFDAAALGQRLLLSLELYLSQKHLRSVCPSWPVDKRAEQYAAEQIQVAFT